MNTEVFATRESWQKYALGSLKSVQLIAKEVEIEIRQDAPVAIRIVYLNHAIAGKGDAKAIVGMAAAGRVLPTDDYLVDAGKSDRIAFDHRPKLAARHETELDRAGSGLKDADNGAASVFTKMRTEDGERIAVRSVEERPERLVERRLVFDRRHI